MDFDQTAFEPGNIVITDFSRRRRYEVVSSDSAGEIETQVKLSAKIKCLQDAEVLRFGFPRLQVGRGSFGASKQEAIFPGLEWLVADEISSSTLDSHPPLNLRGIPHPCKVTVPAMSVQAREFTVSLHYHPLHADGASSPLMPQPEFHSPLKGRGTTARCVQRQPL